ncbi:MAG: hypothetical protein KC486_35590, partial [Myxococcales bacterium]|nr:hypothetical protein [Myxococcales bacterium]
HTAEVAPIAARGLAIVGAVAAVVGLAVAVSLYRARAAEGAVDWGEIGLAWLLPTVVVGGLGIWWLSRLSDARSRRR